MAVSSDATSSLERLKSAHGQRRKMGRNFYIRNCGVNNDRARLGYWSPHGMPQLRERDVGRPGRLMLNKQLGMMSSVPWSAARQPGACVSAIWTQTGRLGKESENREDVFVS